MANSRNDCNADRAEHSYTQAMRAGDRDIPSAQDDSRAMREWAAIQAMVAQAHALEAIAKHVEMIAARLEDMQAVIIIQGRP